MCHLFLSISKFCGAEGVVKSENKTKPITDKLKTIIEKFLYKGTILYKYYHGYGFAWKTSILSKNWSIYKLDKPYFCDVKSQYVIDNISKNNVIIGHIRNDEPKKTKIVASPGIDNTHPFYYKNKIFEHNGFIRDFGKHRAFLKTCILPKFARLIRGETDTEVLFYLLLTFLEKDKSEKRAIQNMFGLFRRNGITGLFNVIYGADDVIVVVRYSLNECNPLPLYIEETPDNILITSIKLTDKQKMIGKNEILVIQNFASLHRAKS